MFGKKKSIGIGGTLISGLPISENSFVQINASPENLSIAAIVGAQKQEFNLPVEKITSVRILNEQEIKSTIEQSVPGMIIGAAAFGVIGAMIGGKDSDKRTERIKTNFTY